LKASTTAHRCCGADEFKAAIEHFRRGDPDAVRAIKAEWGLGDNLDAFNLAYLEARRSGSTDAEAIKQAATKTKTGEWATDAGYSQVQVDAPTRHAPSGLFTHVVVWYRRP